MFPITVGETSYGSFLHLICERCIYGKKDILISTTKLNEKNKSLFITNSALSITKTFVTITGLTNHWVLKILVLYFRVAANIFHM